MQRPKYLLYIYASLRLYKIKDFKDPHIVYNSLQTALIKTDEDVTKTGATSPRDNTQLPESNIELLLPVSRSVIVI